MVAIGLLLLVVVFVYLQVCAVKCDAFVLCIDLHAVVIVYLQLYLPYLHSVVFSCWCICVFAAADCAIYLCICMCVCSCSLWFQSLSVQLLTVMFTCLQLTIENMDLAEKLQASQESQKQLAREVRLCCFFFSLFFSYFFSLSADVNIYLQFEEKLELFYLCFIFYFS